jgi:hypothetical protein
MIRTLFPLPPPKLEREIKKEIRAYLLSVGLIPLRANAAASRGRRAGGSDGLPDFFGILPGGRWWVIEAKRPGAGKRANEAKQNEVLQHLRDNGAFVVVARSVLEVKTAFAVVLEEAPF